jgi:hypothetical protein
LQGKEALHTACKPVALGQSAKAEMMCRPEDKGESKTNMEHHLRKTWEGKCQGMLNGNVVTKDYRLQELDDGRVN